MISLADAKAHLRVEHDDEDALIEGLVAAAERMVEDMTDLLLESRLIHEVRRAFPANGVLSLLKGPVQEITAVEYDPAAGGAAATLGSFRLVEGERGALLPADGAVFPAAWVGPGSVRITYLAGFEAGEAPAPLVLAAKQLLAHFYADRGDRGDALPAGVKALLAPYCQVGLA